MKVIISASFYPSQSSFFITNQIENNYGTTRANMSTAVNKGVIMRYKEVTSNLFKVVVLLVEPSKAISKPHGYLEAYTYIS